MALASSSLRLVSAFSFCSTSRLAAPFVDSLCAAASCSARSSALLTLVSSLALHSSACLKALSAFFSAAETSLVRSSICARPFSISSCSSGILSRLWSPLHCFSFSWSCFSLVNRSST